MEWVEARHMLPDKSGMYLCWDAAEQNMWVGYWNDTGGHDTYGDPRPLGWSGGNCTHWAERPAPPGDA